MKKWTMGDLKLVRDRVEQGDMLSDVCRELGLSRYTVRAALAYHNMLPTKPWKWRLIETAPEGKPIIAINRKFAVPVIAYRLKDQVFDWEGCKPLVGLTHWMPVPSPPAEE